MLARSSASRSILSPRILAFALAFPLVMVGACERGGSTTDPGPTTAPADAPVDLDALADELAHRFIILDGHVDAPMQAVDAERRGEAAPPIHDHAETNFDYPKAREGGLDAPFMSIYTPADLQAEAGASKQFAEQRIDYVLASPNVEPYLRDAFIQREVGGSDHAPVGVELDRRVLD